MKIVDIEAIERRPLAIDYRRQYRGNAVIAVGEQLDFRAPIEFTLELSALGHHEISVQFLAPTDFPLVPALRLLKEHIRTLDGGGRLP